MSVENKIREFLAKGREVGQLSEELQELDEKADNLSPNSKPGDSSAPTQGSSDANPEQDDLSGKGNKEGGLTSEVGKAASAKAKKDGTLPKGNGAKEAPSNFENEANTEDSVNNATSQGVVAKEEAVSEEEEVISEEEGTEEELEVVAEDEEVVAEEDQEVVSEEEETLFGQDIKGLFESEEQLSEEFKTKAAGIFEAVVTARIANEMETIEAELKEEAQLQQETFKEEMVEKLDSFLSYVAENWMKENELAIERGLRAEITEDFISGMKTLFAEHYIQVPEEKYDVLGEMQDKIDSLETKLNESLEEKIEVVAEKQNLQKQAIIKEASDDLTLTEAEKFAKLVEDIDFGSTEIFTEKVAVVKENYFPKQGQQDSEDKLEDTVEGLAQDDSYISRYAQAISQSAKF
tara:strand:- start:4210 stop:5427 length:1218 start_codon:yes stop_codon:yes gene_type:complete